MILKNRIGVIPSRLSLTSRGTFLFWRPSSSRSSIRCSDLPPPSSLSAPSPSFFTARALPTTVPINMPARPYAFLPKDKASFVDLSTVAAKIATTEDKREAAYDVSRKLQAAITKASYIVESGSDEPQPDLEALVIEAVGATATRSPREANLQNRVDDVVRHKAFLHFLDNGALLAPSATPYATDEEYLGGACMGLAKMLERYGLGRATARDVDSVGMAKDLVQEILDYLLQFDFRNGPMRRRYDGTKYALKTLETLLYELAVTGTSLETGGDDDGEKPAKMHKPNEFSSLVAHDELKALRERFGHRENLREALIKRCRDGQKAAKQAIFALHRGDPKKAKHLMDEAEKIITELLPTVEEEPLLRHGSFGNLVEEFAEAKLFYAWLFGTTTNVPAIPPMTPPAKVLTEEEFAPLVLEPMEYLGGLCDLTGEIGRFAVQRATLRDGEGVKLCLATNKSILTALQMLERFPRELGKKMDPLKRSVEKLERILYEMSLSEAAGGRNVQTKSMDIEPEAKAGSNDN